MPFFGYLAAPVSTSVVTNWGDLPAPGAVTPYTHQYFIVGVGVGGSYWYSDGARWRVVGQSVILYSSPVPVVVTNTNTETIIEQFNFPAALCAVGDKLRIQARIERSGGLGTMQIRARLGADGTVADNAIYAPALLTGFQPLAAFSQSFKITSDINLLTVGCNTLTWNAAGTPATGGDTAIPSLATVLKLSLSVKPSVTPEVDTLREFEIKLFTL